MSGELPRKSFDAAFLKSLQEKKDNKWQCRKCFVFNDKNCNTCRGCDADKPSDGNNDQCSNKRLAPVAVDSDSKKPKLGGFVFVPSSTTPSTSIFGSVAPKQFSFGTSTPIKFGIGENARTISFAVEKVEEVSTEPQKEDATTTEVNTKCESSSEVKIETEKSCKIEEKNEEDEDSDYRKYESGDESDYAAQDDKDYSSDEVAVDVMKGRKVVSSENCITNNTSLSENNTSYSLYVIGSNECGQLGLNDISSIGKPLIQQVVTALCPSRIACGSLSNIILTTNGMMYSWGCNDSHQLGRTDVDEITPTRVEQGEIGEDEKLEQVVAGSCHAAVRTLSGKVFAWGTYLNSKGALGWSEEIRMQSTPKQVHFPPGVKIVSICSGENHSLGLTDDGMLYGWGSDEQGQLVVHMMESMRSRALKPRSLPFKEGRKKMRVIRMWAGGFHSMVQLENGHIYTFGMNNWGQLGDGQRTEEATEPRHIGLFDDLHVRQAALSQHASAVLLDNGMVYSCGRNSYGQLGRCSTDAECDPVFSLVKMPNGVKIQQIACGLHHYVAIDENGLLYTWGFGDSHQLGNGQYADEMSPYHVRSCELCNKVVVIADGGAQHTVVLTRDI